MKTTYEEKTFEAYFNSEIALEPDFYFPFGQVQEGMSGADSAAQILSRFPWTHFRIPFLNIPKLTGVNLENIAQMMEDVTAKELDAIPSFKTHILFQYRSPEVIGAKNGKEWRHWKQKYYRYEIKTKQQKLLMNIATAVSQRALVLYASPAIETALDLVYAKQGRHVIDSTNFRSVTDLGKNKRYSFIDGGGHSIMGSALTRVENFNLMDELTNAPLEGSASVADEVVSFAAAVIDVATKDSELGPALQALLEPYVITGMDQYYPKSYAIISMALFKEVSGIHWVVRT